MEGVCRLKIGGARQPTDILECALEQCFSKWWSADRCWSVGHPLPVRRSYQEMAEKYSIIIMDSRFALAIFVIPQNIAMHLFLP